jgi:hypothetical protein
VISEGGGNLKIVYFTENEYKYLYPLNIRSLPEMTGDASKVSSSEFCEINSKLLPAFITSTTPEAAT